MSVDVFGRYAGDFGASKLSPQRHRRSRLVMTSTGDYDFSNKRICNIKDPEESDDAVNLKSLRRRLSPYMRYHGSSFDARARCITNVKDPVSETDVVTKKYLNSVTPLKLADGYSLGQLKLQDVAFPSFPGDAINLQYAKNNFIYFSNGVVDGKQCIISHVREGKADSDAVTVGQTIVLKSDIWDGKSKRISNVGLPIEPSDVATKEYVSDMTPKVDSTNWYFRFKRLSQVSDPAYDGEAVNLRTLKTTSLCKQNDSFDAGNLKIVNLADGTEESEAANVRVVRQLIKDLNRDTDLKVRNLGVALFKYIHSQSGARASGSGINENNFINWDKVLLMHN